MNDPTKEKRKRGRPTGTGGPHGKPHAGSWADWLLGFEVGERRYMETTLTDCSVLCRTCLKPAYLNAHEVFKDRKYTGTMLTATAAKKLGDVRYLLCIEREK